MAKDLIWDLSKNYYYIFYCYTFYFIVFNSIAIFLNGKFQAFGWKCESRLSQVLENTVGCELGNGILNSNFWIQYQIDNFWTIKIVQKLHKRNPEKYAMVPLSNIIAGGIRAMRNTFFWTENYLMCQKRLLSCFLIYLLTNITFNK